MNSSVKFSSNLTDVLSYSKEEAIRFGSEYIYVHHLILGMINIPECKGLKILNTLGVDINYASKELRDTIKPRDKNNSNLLVSKEVEKALKMAYLEAKKLNSFTIGTEHLLLAILKDERNTITQIIKKYKVDYNIVFRQINVN